MDLKSLNIDQLQEELSKRGLDTDGSHSDLILRLQAALDDEEFGIEGEENEEVSKIDEVNSPDEVNGQDVVQNSPENSSTISQAQPNDPVPVSNNGNGNKKRNSVARRAASAAKLIMSFDNPIGNSPSDLEYVKLQKDAQPVDNKRTRDRRFNVPDKLVRRPKNTPPPAPPVDPVEEEKRRSRALRFGITLPPPPPEVPSQVVQVTHNKPKGKKRNTGGIIAADGDGDEDKKRAREIRFQSTGLGPTDAVLQDLQEKKKRRIEKFASMRAEDLSTTGGESLTEINQQEAREARFSFAIDADTVVQQPIDGET